jgi:hypothetical protein
VAEDREPVVVAPGQLDMFEAQQAKAEGMGRVLEHAAPDYRVALERAIAELAARGGEFDSDDVRRIAGDPPRTTHPNVAGAVMSAMAKRGLIEKVGYGLSSRREGHGNLVRRWRGRRS